MRYVGGHVSIAGGLENAISNTLKIDANCMQIFAGSPRLWLRKPFSETEIKNFLSGVIENHLGPVFIHALYLVNLASTNQDLLDKSVSSLIMDMQNGSRIHSSGVIIHIGSHLGAGFKSVRDQVVASIQRILAQTENCDLLLENAAGQNGKIGSLEELSFLVKKVSDPRIKICLDTCHLFAGGVDLRDEKKTEQLITNLVELQLMDKVKCLHLNDCASDLDSHRDLHANLGEGKIGLEGLKTLINHKGFSDLPIILEVPGENKQGPNLQNIAIAKGLSN